MATLLGCVSFAAEQTSRARVLAMLKKTGHTESMAGVVDMGGACFAVTPNSTGSADGSGIWSAPDERQVVAYRGDVVNHMDLRRFAPDYPYTGQNPLESVCVAYAAKGMKSVLAHNGPCILFAHTPRSGTTRILRDRLGQMCLFYTAQKDFFAFATDMAPLLALVRPRLNADAVSYRAFEFTVGPETLFQDVYALAPGEYIDVRRDLDQVKNTYWTVWDNLVEPPSTPDKAVDAVHELLEDAVRLRTLAGGASTGLISGGIDSSLTCCLLRPKVLHHVHYNFADFNELEYAECLAEHIGAELRLIKPTREDYLEAGDSILRTLGTPAVWTSFTLWASLRAVKEDGFDAIFTGDGADELFAGYHRYHLLFHDEAIKNLEAMQGYGYLIQRYYGSRVERYARLINRCPNAHDGEVNQYLEETLTRIHERCNGDVVNFMTLVDLYTTSQILFLMADRIGAHFGVTSRSPFLDYRMVRLAFSMDARFKIREGSTKWVLKKVAERLLPAKIAQRKDKRGFSAPVNYWFGWDKPGSYDRRMYTQQVFAEWLRLFSVERS